MRKSDCIKPPRISHSYIILWVVWSHIKGDASCFICERFATSADNLLDIWIPTNLFKCLRAIISIPCNWEAQRRGNTRRSLMEVSGLLRLDQMGSWEPDELVAMTADTLLLSCLFPTMGTWINWQPMCQHELIESHLTSPQCGSCTCRVCDPFAMKNCGLVPPDLKHWGSCQAVALRS